MATTAETSYLLEENNFVLNEGQDPYVLKVRDLANEDRPRERLQKYGPKNLSVQELLTLLLGTGTRKEEVNTMSHRIIREYGEKAIFHESNPVRLAETLDIPSIAAIRVVAGFELGRRFYQSKQGKPVFIRNAGQAYQHLKGIGESKKEQLTALYLNSRYELVHQEVISIGSVTANIVHPREVFSPAIEHSSVAVVIAHNHPSGNSSPTIADAEVTEQLVQAGKLLGIDLVDHLIITNKSYRSLLGPDE